MRKQTYPLGEPHASTAFTYSDPEATSPKTQCLPLRWGVGTVVMKNWELFLHLWKWSVSVHRTGAVWVCGDGEWNPLTCLGLNLPCYCLVDFELASMVLRFGNSWGL